MGILTDLATQILNHARSIEDTLATHSLPQPSFAADGPPSLPGGPDFRELQKNRLALVDAARDIEHLTTGPEAWIKSSVLVVRTLAPLLLRLSNASTSHHWRFVAINISTAHARPSRTIRSCPLGRILRRTSRWRNLVCRSRCQSRLVRGTPAALHPSRDDEPRFHRVSTRLRSSYSYIRCSCENPELQMVHRAHG